MPSVSNRSKTMNSIQKSHHASLTTYLQMITERSIKLLSSVMLISANWIKLLRLWLTCFEDGPIRILTFAWWMFKTRKTMVSWQAFPSLPLRAPLAFLSHLKLPFPSLSNACHAGYRDQWGVLNHYYVKNDVNHWKQSRKCRWENVT